MAIFIIVGVWHHAVFHVFMDFLGLATNPSRRMPYSLIHLSGLDWHGATIAVMPLDYKNYLTRGYLSAQYISQECGCQREYKIINFADTCKFAGVIMSGSVHKSSIKSHS